MTCDLDGNVCAECSNDSDCGYCEDNQSICRCDSGRCVSRQLCPNEPNMCSDPTYNPESKRLTYMHASKETVTPMSKPPPG